MINIPGRVVKDTQHGHNTVASTIGATNIGLRGPNVVDRHTNATGVLGNDGTVLECIVNAINRVFLHRHEKARTHLWARRAGIKESRRGVCKVPKREHVVGFQNRVNVVAVNTDSHTHEHLLRPFGNLAVHLEQIGLFQSLESKIVQLKVALVHHRLVERFLVLHHNLQRFVAHQRGRLLRLGVLVVVKGLNVGTECAVCHLV